MTGLTAELLAAVVLLVLAFVLGTTWGLFLNVTHMYRMQRWANKVCDRLDLT